MATIYRMTWDEVRARVAERILEKLPLNALTYGVPRGGSIVSALAGNPAMSPYSAVAIVDDIIDSGRTASRYEETGLPFLALVDKTGPDKDIGWVHFPWEEEPDVDVESSVVRLLQYLGEDVNRDGLKDTPARVIKAWREMTSGYSIDPNEILKKDFDESGYDQMIMCRDIEFESICEHHMLPFVGTAHVGYIPSNRVVGLSKMARLVDCFARRLQIQERMTTQIAQAMNDVLHPRGVGVTIEARHMCMSCRGVRKPKASMVTTCLMGLIKDDHKAREEFLMVAKGHQ